MNDPARTVVPDHSEADDAGLAEKVAELVERLRQGERIDLTDDESRHAEELRRLLPTIRMMGDLAGPAARDSELGSLGDFQIIREAGRGGMGIIYEAVQVSLGRRVALKVLLNAAALDPRHLQRFQVEAQAAASMHHPGIVPVFAIATERGNPFPRCSSSKAKTWLG
jgi:serine/threonine protein kinase